MKAAFFEIDALEEEYIKKGLDIEHTFFEEDLNKKNADKAENYEIISTRSHSQINKELLKNLPELKLIATRATGFDNIDLEECKKKSIAVCNVPLYGETSVAEHTFALILAVSKKICESNSQAKKGNFSIEGLRGFDLKGKTLGVIGAGSIGRAVIKIAKCFEMNVLAYDIIKDDKAEKDYGFEYVDLDYLLKNSDIITLHVPLTKETKHMINNKSIKRIKQGAVIINTSRGKLIETTPLIKALKDNKIIGAGLDVLEEENDLIKGEVPETIKELIENENVIITPHNAFNTKEAIKRKTETTINNIKEFIKGKPTNLIK